MYLSGRDRGPTPTSEVSSTTDRTDQVQVDFDPETSTTTVGGEATCSGNSPWVIPISMGLFVRKSK